MATLDLVKVGMDLRKRTDMGQPGCDCPWCCSLLYQPMPVGIKLCTHQQSCDRLAATPCAPIQLRLPQILDLSVLRI
jgi:hypothetical protein